MFFRKIINVFFIILAALFQTSFLNNEPFPFNRMKIILLAIIFLTLTESFYNYYWLIFGGLILEFYSQYYFGVLFLTYFITFFIIVWSFKNLFTNKSLYSFIIIGLIAFLSYNFFIYIFSGLTSLIMKNYLSIKLDQYYFLTLISEIILNLISLVILFIFYRFISKKMKAVFIIKYDR